MNDQNSPKIDGNQAALEARLDELLPAPASGFEMPMSTVAQRVLRILGDGGSSQSRKALTPKQKTKLAQFSSWEMKQFQRIVLDSNRG